MRRTLMCQVIRRWCTVYSLHIILADVLGLWLIFTLVVVLQFQGEPLTLLPLAGARRAVHWNHPAFNRLLVTSPALSCMQNKPVQQKLVAAGAWTADVRLGTQQTRHLSYSCLVFRERPYPYLIRAKMGKYPITPWLSQSCPKRQLIRYGGSM